MTGSESRFFSVGHSTREMRQFIAILQAAGIEMVADVRSIPKSRRNPQYNTDLLSGALGEQGIGYLHFLDLGGRRAKQGADRDPRNAWWQHPSFHNYADYALTDTFQSALDRLIEAGRVRPLAMMCSEAVWWRCHRRIITDYLLQRQFAVFHLMGDGREDPARMTEAARDAGGGRLIYPPCPG